VWNFAVVCGGSGILKTCFKNAFKHTTQSTQIATLIADLLNPSKDRINKPYTRPFSVVKIAFA
jgi:hypothetical protein